MRRHPDGPAARLGENGDTGRSGIRLPPLVELAPRSARLLAQQEASEESSVPADQGRGRDKNELRRSRASTRAGQRANPVPSQSRGRPARREAPSLPNDRAANR